MTVTNMNKEKQSLTSEPQKKPRSVQTYGRQGEEGDTQEGEPCGQHPSGPRLWRLVSVADGGQSDLWKHYVSYHPDRGWGNKYNGKKNKIRKSFLWTNKEPKKIYMYQLI